ncbi:MAG TPA: Gldg family protein, partial [Mariniflexile sp.]|nr:Gldg family protein [Mariniflexile sp.]
MKKHLKYIGMLAIVLIAINYVSSFVFKRFDLTEDKRYTLSDATLKIVKNVESPLIVDVFLSGDDSPSEFRRLQSETKQLLEEFSAKNSNIVFNFINPLEDDATRDRNIQQLTQRGLTPMQLSVQESGKASQAIIFPWALASYNNETISIPLVKNKIGASQQDLVTNSVQHLEYAFADGFSKLTNPKSKKIAILRGNKQLPDKYMADFSRKIGEYYRIAPYTLDSVA